MAPAPSLDPASEAIILQTGHQIKEDLHTLTHTKYKNSRVTGDLDVH